MYTARVGVFQSAKFKSFNKVYTDTSVNVGSQELSAVCLSICALLLICASTIFNGIVNNFEKFKFPTFLNAKKMSFLLFPKTIFIFYFYIQALYDKQINKLLINLLLICCGDVESNPGPKKQHQISFCHWNLNGLAAHNFSKVSLLQAISVSKTYDIICLSETFLDSSIDSSDERITIEGYNLLRADHPSNKKGEESAFIIRNIFLSLK